MLPSITFEVICHFVQTKICIKIVLEKNVIDRIELKFWSFMVFEKNVDELTSLII